MLLNSSLIGLQLTSMAASPVFAGRQRLNVAFSSFARTPATIFFNVLNLKVSTSSFKKTGMLLQAYEEIEYTATQMPTDSEVTFNKCAFKEISNNGAVEWSGSKFIFNNNLITGFHQGSGGNTFLMKLKGDTVSAESNCINNIMTTCQSIIIEPTSGSVDNGNIKFSLATFCDCTADTGSSLKFLANQITSQYINYTKCTYTAGVSHFTLGPSVRITNYGFDTVKGSYAADITRNIDYPRSEQDYEFSAWMIHNGEFTAAIRAESGKYTFGHSMFRFKGDQPFLVGGGERDIRIYNCYFSHQFDGSRSGLTFEHCIWGIADLKTIELSFINTAQCVAIGGQVDPNIPEDLYGNELPATTKSGLSPGAVAAIVIVVLVVVAAVAFCVVWFVVLKKPLPCKGN